MKYPDHHLERIAAMPHVNYDNPLPKDYQSFQYRPIESVEDYSYGILIHIHYKTPYVHATRFEGVYKLYLTEQDAYKAYRKQLETILEAIRKQSNETLPF
jgi:hypothetical protein